MEERHLVFVYGTLKSNQPNHDLLKPPNNASFVGNGLTVNRFPLVIASRYNIPYALDLAGHGDQIQGEVYEVDKACFEKLDELEEHPDYYVRRLTPVQLMKGDEQTEAQLLRCHMYFLHDFHDKLLQLPHYATYSSDGDHGLPYCIRHDRQGVKDKDNYSSKQDVKKMSA